MNWQAGQAIKDIDGLEPKRNASGMVERFGEVRMRMLFQSSSFYPPQIPEILPSIERIARDGVTQVQWKWPRQCQGKEEKEAENGEMSSGHDQ